MSKTDTAIAVVIIASAAALGYSVYRKTQTATSAVAGSGEGVFSFLKNLFTTDQEQQVVKIVEQIVQQGPGVVSEVSSSFQTPAPALPSYVSQDEVNRHVQLVTEYLLRHPALNVINYYEEYPETAWILPYAFPELVNLKPIETQKSVNYYEAAAFAGIAIDPFGGFGGISSDEVLARALAAGYVI